MQNQYQAQMDKDLEDLYRHIRNRMSDEDMARIKQAYEFAALAHTGQTRKSGAPYIVHPIAVSKIVAEELELDANTIIAAFLHDVVEDTDYTVEDIRERFGDDVAFLVATVTKQKKQKYNHSKQIDNFHQMLASVHYDVRALLIKLADRLHNMRTLSSMRPDKQMKIAGETDYFYAPLANRLGMYQIKRELENLSFQYRCPKDYEFISGQMDLYRMENEEKIREMARKYIECLAGYGLKVRAEIRYRTPYSIWRKMKTNGSDFNHIDIKHIIRLIYDVDGQGNEFRKEKATTLQIYSALTDNFKERPGSVVNFIDTPKENGYQSFHVTLLTDRGTWQEVHISSERMVRHACLGCTADQDKETSHVWLEKLRAILKDMAEHTDAIDFMDGVTSSFYNEDIMVYTPMGRIVILPQGATALDFAFEIHGEVGQHAEYARINGSLKSVKTVLHRGDCVEIGTNPEVEPSPDWNDHVLTYKAKKSLKQFFNSKKKLDYNRCPYCHPLPGDEVIGFKEEDGTTTIHRRDCQRAIRQASQQGDSIIAVRFDENPDFVYPVRIQIRGVDRYHLLIDLVNCITEEQHLYMTGLETETVDRIASCTIDFLIHSVSELQTTIDSILRIKGIDEVNRLDIE